MYKRKMMVFTVALAFALALTVAACNVNDADRTPAATPTPTATPPVGTTTPVPEANVANVTVADITSNWTNYEGKTVTVVAFVDEVLGPRAFTLDEDEPLENDIDDDLLVLSPKAGNMDDIDERWENNKVRVTGVVRRFVAADVERETGWDMDPQLEAEYEGKKPALIAESVERVR